MPAGFYQRSNLAPLLQPASAEFLAWLESVGATPCVVEAFRPGTLSESVVGNPYVLLSEVELRAVNCGKQDAGRCIDFGLLVFAFSALLGDPLVIDLWDSDGACGLVSHATMGYIEDVREDYWPVTFTLAEAIEALATEEFPDSYFDTMMADIERGKAERGEL